MTSLVYPTYSRIINVYRPTTNNAMELATDLGAGGNISAITEKASFTLCYERGCCEGELTLVSTGADGLYVRRMNPFLLAYGDIIQMVPEVGADAWYTGYIRTRSRDLQGRHVYGLYGLAGKLTDLPVTTLPTASVFGADGTGWPIDLGAWENVTLGAWGNTGVGTATVLTAGTMHSRVSIIAGHNYTLRYAAAALAGTIKFYLGGHLVATCTGGSLPMDAFVANDCIAGDDDTYLSVVADAGAVGGGIDAVELTDMTQYPGTSVYLPSNSTGGLVQWLLESTHVGGDGTTTISGPIIGTNTGILDPHNWNTQSAGMSVVEADQIQRMILSSEAKTAATVEELARSVKDYTSAYVANPRPVIWGVKADRTFYFQFRPDTEVITLELVKGESIPRCSLYGTPVILSGGQVTEDEADEIRNVLFFRGGAEIGSTPLVLTYFDDDSIAYYKTWKSDVQEIPAITRQADADRFAAVYFQRYARTHANYRIAGVVIPSATALPFPWDGYAQVTTDTVTGIMGRRSISAVTVDFGETPIASIQLGSTEGTFAASGSGVRWPGSVFKKAFDAVPRASGLNSSVRTNTIINNTTTETNTIASDAFSFCAGW